MKPLRAVFSLLLVAIATVLVGCGGPNVKVPPTYTPEKIAELQLYLTPLTIAQGRLDELGGYVDKSDWNNVKSMLHGPFGSLRASSGYINRILLERDQSQAVDLSETLFSDLERLDVAAANNLPDLAAAIYRTTAKDFDTYLDFIPTEPDSNV